MYIELIKEMSTPDHKLHNFLRKEVQEVRELKVYNNLGKAERFKNQPRYIDKYNETLSSGFIVLIV
jgi:hypothetical protein